MGVCVWGVGLFVCVKWRVSGGVQGKYCAVRAVAEVVRVFPRT